MKYLLTLALFVSCINQKKLDGLWKFELMVQSKTIPFFVQILDSDFKILNINEEINLKIDQSNDSISIPINAYDIKLELQRSSNGLKGYWIKLNRKPEYKIPLTAKRINKKEEFSLPTNFAKKWKISFKKQDGSTREALLLFTKNHASVITQTGDYRFLRPVLKGSRLNLYGFDGSFSFNFEGKLENNTYSGTMYSGLNWNQKFVATIDNDFNLKDAYSITKLPKEALDVCLTNLNKTQTCLNRKSKRPKVIQIFGSWCPNCIDETKFIQSYRKKNKPKVDFYIVSFERAKNKKHALKLLNKTKALYQIDYPILLGGFTKETKVSDVFIGINNFASYPTTIFVDKKNHIRKVHSGFTGPATGSLFEEFSFEFDQTLKKLQAE